MTDAALITFVILGATIALFASDRVRLDVVALLSLLALAITGVAPLDVALSGFSNAAVLMIAGLFVIGAALTETGVADWLGRRVERVAGTTEQRAIVVVMGATALVSAFMSSTGTVAILLPVVGTLAARRGFAPSRLLMPLAFAAHLGSNLTLISTPPNLLVSDALRSAGYEPFRFFSFIVPGAAVLVVGVAYMAFVGRRLLPVGDARAATRCALSQDELAAEYGLTGSLWSVRIPPGSSLVGQTLGGSNMRAAYGVNVIGIVRAGEALRVVPTATFEEGDELSLVGDPSAVARCIEAFELEEHARPTKFALPGDESLAEVVLPRQSRLVGLNLRDAKFRDKYRATVLGVRRVEGGAQVCHTKASLRDLKLLSGDTLLVKGRRRYLRNLQDERDDLVLVALPDATPGVFVDPPRAFAAMAITLAMLLVMAFGLLPNVIAVLCAALLMVVSRCVRPEGVYRSVNWESVVLIAGMIPLATSLERTGGTKLVVDAVVARLDGASPTAILALLVAITSAMGMVLSNTATAVLVAPIAIRLATAFGVRPEPLLMGVAFASSAAFATPIASPVNVLVMTPGGYRFAHYTRVGLPLQLLVLATAVLVIPLVWRF